MTERTPAAQLAAVIPHLRQMGRKARIQKSREQRIGECETHLYFLWDAYRLYPEQRDRYKQVATELRVLVGDRRANRRLLISLMDDLGFVYEVQPPVAPFDKQPIPMVGWRDDPDHQALVQQLQEANGGNEQLDALLERQAASRKPIPFAHYVDNALAVYIAPYEYSYRDLVLAVSQQLGSGHKDTAVDEPIVQMSQIVIGGDEGHIAPLIKFAELVVEVGAQFIAFTAAEHGHNPKYFQVNRSGT